MINTEDVGYFQRKTQTYYDFGNDPHNHDMLNDLFHKLWRFSQCNHVYVNEIDFAEGRWDGPRRMVFELLWDYADDWESVEHLSISAVKYSEWTALVSRAAEICAATISMPLRSLRIRDIHWFNMDTFVVEFGGLT